MFWIALIALIFVVMTEVDSYLWRAVLLGVAGLSWYLLGFLSYAVFAAIVIGIIIKTRWPSV
jgi:hypothetical protein